MTDLPPTPADDGFERHYAEKIWALVPEVYRSLDGEADRPGPLRALVEILAEQAAIARRSVDRLWADSRIDEADDWAVPYIGALVGARPVNALNRAVQRANVGRTILYRRRLGTVRLAELLADDIADWDAVANEAFKRLIRHWHMLDGGLRPGPISRTPQWGYAELRPVRIDAVVDRAHDDLSHYPDFRRHRGVLGRHNIPKVNLHLFRQYAFPLTDIDPVEIAPGLYALDPSGRDVALFQVGDAGQPDEADSDAALLRLGRAVEDECKARREWEMRAPIPCRRLNFAGFAPRFEHAPVGLEDELAPIYGRRFATEAGMLEAADAALSEDPTPPNALSDAQAAHLIAAAMEDASPRRNLLPGGDPATLSIVLANGQPNDPPLGPEALYGANLEAWGEDLAPAGWIEALVDPALGRVRLMDALAADEALQARLIYYGAFWPVGAGTHDRASGLATPGFVGVDNVTPDWTGQLSGELRILDNRTYRPKIPANGIIEADGDLTLSAADGKRPYVILTPGAGDTVTIRSTQAGARLVIDGLWIGVFEPGASGPTTLRIDGTWSQVVLRNVSLDPGGERAAAPGQPPEPIPAVRLAFSGAVDDLVIERCVTGRIVEVGTPLDPCALDTVKVSDSIIRSVTDQPAIQLRNASLTIDATTVFGDVVVGRIDASELLADGRVLAEDQQTGCFRFSAAARGSRTPHPYESHFFEDGLPFGTFMSTRFGDAGYAQLSEIAPFEVREGGEDGVEMGAFKAALDPIKRADLGAKLREFMPLNVIIQQIIET